MDAYNILANIGPCEFFPHMSIPKSFLLSPPNICPKRVLKNARLIFSSARYTFTFLGYTAELDCDASVSLVVFFLYESIHSFYNVSSTMS